MAEKETNSSSEEIKVVEEIKKEENNAAVEGGTVVKEEVQSESQPLQGGGGGAWGGWDFSPLSYLTDLQKAATVAAEEISRNAVEAAKTAAKSIAEMQNAEDSESSKDGDTEASAVEEESEDENEKLRKAALVKLEKASEDSFLGQGLKVFDNKVENFASGAWQALGNVWKGSSEFVHKLEDSAVNLAGSIQHGGLPGATGSVAPSIIESGKALTAKGMQVLELVGKETMDLLIAESGIEVEKNTLDAERKIDEEHLFEEVAFDRCFYIYGGPEQLEELEALSSHYALIFNRRKTKLPSEQKSVYDGKLKELLQIFDLSSEIHGSSIESEKGKKVDAGIENTINEMKTLHDSSVRKAAELAAGFANALSGQAPADIILRTSGRLDSLHSEGVHGLSEMCCFAVTQLLMLGKSIISNANRVQDPNADLEIEKTDWPEDSVEKAKIIRIKAQRMSGIVEAVSNSFITGISDVAEVYLEAMKIATSDSHAAVPENFIQEKITGFSEDLRKDYSIALSKIQDGLQHLSYLILSTSMPAA